MVTVTGLSHVALTTAQSAAMEAYLVDVLGFWACRRDPDGVGHFSLGGAGAQVELIPGDRSSLHHVGFALAEDSDLDAVTDELAAAGLTVRRPERQDPNSGGTLEISDPEDNTIHLVLGDGSLVEPAPTGAGLRPLRIGHIATRVRDVARVQAFYVDVLGFSWSDSIGPDFSFLRCNADHHAVNLLKADRPGEPHHIAFELSDLLHTQRAADRLSQAGISLAWGPGRHGPGHNLFTYHIDPDGHTIELYAGMDRMGHEGQGFFDPRSWHADSPPRPKVWDGDDLRTANRWGIAPPETFMV
jgi:catechol-2,3-dioxygenase